MVKADDMDRASRFLARLPVTENEAITFRVSLACEFATVREQTIGRMREAICAAVESAIVGMMGGGQGQ